MLSTLNYSIGLFFFFKAISSFLLRTHSQEEKFSYLYIFLCADWSKLINLKWKCLHLQYSVLEDNASIWTQINLWKFWFPKAVKSAYIWQRKILRLLLVGVSDLLLRTLTGSSITFKIQALCHQTKQHRSLVNHIGYIKLVFTWLNHGVWLNPTFSMWGGRERYSTYVFDRQWLALMKPWQIRQRWFFWFADIKNAEITNFKMTYHIMSQLLNLR